MPSGTVKRLCDLKWKILTYFCHILLCQWILKNLCNYTTHHEQTDITMFNVIITKIKFKTKQKFEILLIIKSDHFDTYTNKTTSMENICKSWLPIVSRNFLQTTGEKELNKWC